MKTIKIFLASSDELENDRMAFGNLVRKLDKIYERRGIRVELFEWEDYDAAYNGQRKQDEYNDHIKASDLFLALFHTKAGKFTIEEFDVATEEFRQKAAPKVYVYCKDLQAGESESPELAEFKRRLFDEMGHYWCRYGNRDTMQLHFVMQLQLVESSRMDALKVDEKGAVTLDGTPVAHMDQLPFAAGNEAYRKMQAELLELPDKIDKARERVKKLPDDEDLRDDLQAKLDHYNQLKEDFAQLQQNLFNTAKTIANLQQQQVSAMLRRAIEAFECGDLERANALLDEIAHEADRHMERLEQHQELLEKDRQIVHQDIDAFMLQAQTVLADTDIPIEETIDRVLAIYAKADDWAQRSAYDKEKYAQLLSVYGSFLFSYAYYNEAETILNRLIAMCEGAHGTDNPSTALAYNSIAGVYLQQGKYDKAHEYFFKALGILDKASDSDYLDTKIWICNNVGLTFTYIGDYHNALKYYGKALSIQEQLGTVKSEATGGLYINIADAYRLLGDFDNALEYCNKAFEILEEELEPIPTTLAQSYNIGGLTLSAIGELDEAIKLFNIAIDINEMAYGLDHPLTAHAYSAIAQTYFAKGAFDKGLEYCNKALDIQEKKLGTENQLTASSYCQIGIAHNSLGDYEKGLQFCRKALEIQQHIFGEKHQSIASSLVIIGQAYYGMQDFEMAMKYFKQALEMFEEVLGPEHVNVAVTTECIGNVFYQQGDYSKALKYYKKTLSIRESLFGPENLQTASCYANIGLIYSMNGDNEEAIKQYTKAQDIYDKTLPPEHPAIANIYDHLGTSYMKLGNYNLAMSYLEKALAINEKVLGDNHPETKNVKHNIGILKELIELGNQYKPAKRGGFFSRLFGKKK